MAVAKARGDGAHPFGAHNTGQVFNVRRDIQPLRDDEAQRRLLPIGLEKRRFDQFIHRIEHEQ